MRLFILKSLLFFFMLLIIPLLGVNLFNLVYNFKESDKNIFIWGDSQMVQGVDLIELNKLTSQKIYSAAKHGAGVYDFLVFSQTVPKNSLVCVSFSIPCLTREKVKDRNESFLSFKSLGLLLLNNYSTQEIYSIIQKNVIPQRIFTSKHNLYPVKDKVNMNYPISMFKKLFSNNSLYKIDKNNLYFEAIKELKSKNCKIIMVEFPLNNKIQEVYKLSNSEKDILKLKNKIFATYDVLNYSLHLDESKNFMFDLTHLNKLGAKWVTFEMSNKINSIKKDQFIYLKIK